MNSFFYDEVINIVTDLKEKKLIDKFNSENVSVLTDGCGFEAYVSAVLKQCKGCSAAYKSKQTFIYIADFETNDIYSDCDKLKSMLEKLPEGSEFIYVSVFSFEKSFDGNFTAVSERELKTLSHSDENLIRAANLLKNEELLKKYIHKLGIKAVRFNNIFGPEISPMGDFKDIITDFKTNNHITLNKIDYENHVSVSYIRNAVNALFTVLCNGKIGNIYNASDTSVTVADIKNSLYKSFCKNGVELSFSDEKRYDHFAGYRCLCCRKIQSVGYVNNTDFDDALIRTVISDENEYINKYIEKTYDGKIDIIRDAEIEMLREIDRICKKNNIKYFLVGGSLLGAERNGGFIPWDDDIDICMMREDFEKFRNICPGELSEKYAYQSYRDEKSTHYIFDKIRLKGTYFSSEHSGKFDNMQNGIFADIFVFDKTANSAFLQKFHIFLIVMLRRLIHVRWTEEPVTGKFASISKLILPLVCLLPFSFYHSLFEFVLRFFEKSKKSKYIIDGIGLYIKKGALPLEWMSSFQPVNFAGITVLKPICTDNYLKMWYGEEYLTPPNVSKRTSGHKIARLDLGNYLLKKEKDDTESAVSLSGELFDK